ncbi:MAG: hypothetical protein WAV31_00535, partial [Candidatus Moraniibacteriota bacterium]
EINPEMLAEKSTQEMEEKAKKLSLENSEKTLADETDSIGIDKTKQEKILEENGIKGKLRDVFGRTGAIFEDFRLKINKVIASGMAVMAFSGAGDFKEAKLSEKSGSRPAAELIQGDQEKIHEEAIRKIREVAIDADNENSFIITKKNGIYIFNKGAEGDKASSVFGGKEIRECIESDVDEIELIHTHPARLIDKNDVNIKEKVRKKEIKDILMPPSVMDVVGLIRKEDLEYNPNKKNVKIREKVVDPFGEWEYSFPENSRLAEAVDRLIKENSLEEMYKYSGLDSEEVKGISEIVEKNSKILNEGHPANYLFRLFSILSSYHDEKIKSAEDKLLVGFVRKDKELRERYGDVYRDIDKIIENERKILGYGSKESQALTRENMGLYKKNGVILEYTPFEDTEQEVYGQDKSEKNGSREKSAHEIYIEKRNENAKYLKEEFSKHVGSKEYLDKLAIEFNGDFDRAKKEQERRVGFVNSVRIDVNSDAEAWSQELKEEKATGYYDTGEHKIFIDKALPVYLLADRLKHELSHASTKGPFFISEKAKKIFSEAYQSPNKEESAWKYGEKVSHGMKDEYLSDPVEMAARKKQLDLELKSLNIKKYGERFTQEHYIKIMEAYKNKAFSDDTMIFIETTTPAEFEKIFNEIAENENEKPNSTEQV